MERIQTLQKPLEERRANYRGRAGEGVSTLDTSAGGAALHNGGKQRCSPG